MNIKLPIYSRISQSKLTVFNAIYSEFCMVRHIDRNNLLTYNHKTDTNNIPIVHDIHPTIQKFNQDIINGWRKFSGNTSTGKPINLHLLLHTGYLLALNAFWSTVRSTIPSQHCLENFNVIQKDAKYAIL